MTNKLGSAIAAMLILALLSGFIVYAKAPEISKEEIETIAETAEFIAPDETVDLALSEEEFLLQIRMKEYPVATQVWLYMKDTFGWSDTVCAGIMGNIMAEIGGGTLNFDNWNHDTPYGMFQWLGQRKIDIKEKYGAEPNIFEQLDFMYDELHGTNGVRQQVEGWQRDKILNANNPKDVATYFCVYFERPGNSGSVRRSYAQTAYEYFAN